VSAFDVLSPHADLQITARSLVEVRPRPIEHTGITWQRLEAEAARSIETVEQLVQTNRTMPHPDVAEIARSIASQHDDPGRAAHDIVVAIGDAVEYMSGVTGVHSTAVEAWEARKGVCQDMAHIALGALRSVGIPARYISGYLHPKPDAEVGVAVTGESHAWVEWFAGEWQGFDPTNNIEIGDRHVLVGRGRDYNDVPPLRGVYAGPFKSQLFVRVTITREA
jgi:transglutaminase-like putative cysteine protease